MERVTITSLRLALAVAAVGSVVILGLMVLSFFVPIDWHRWNALVFFAGTALLAGARYLHNLATNGPRSAEDIRDI